MYIDLKKSVQNLIDIESDRKRLYCFARERYNEKFPNIKKIDASWQAFDTYEIIDINTISINYKYGAGDYEYYANFEVDLKPYYRDGVLDSLK